MRSCRNKMSLLSFFLLALVLYPVYILGVYLEDKNEIPSIEVMPSWCNEWDRTEDSPPEQFYTSMERSSDNGTFPYKIYKNIYWTSHRFFSLVPLNESFHNSSSFPERGISVTSLSVPFTLPENSTYNFTRNLRLCRLSGTTLYLDFPFTSSPDHHGYWSEIAFPVFSVLRRIQNLQKLSGKPPAWGSSKELMDLISKTALNYHQNGFKNGMEALEALQVPLDVVNRVLLPNLRRPLSSFFTQLLTLALSPVMPPHIPSIGRGSSLETGSRGNGYTVSSHKGPLYYVPTILDTDDTSHVYLKKLGWMSYEKLMVVDDRYTNPEFLTGFMSPEPGDVWVGEGSERYVRSSHRTGFFSSEDGQEFRRLAFEMTGLSFPEPTSFSRPLMSSSAPTTWSHSSKPRFITLLLEDSTSSGWRPYQLPNALELLNELRKVAAEYGMDARVVSLTQDALFLAHVRTMRDSAVIVARHNPLLSSAVFLAPGAAVLELLPYKVEWQKMTMSYFNATKSVGDIHHWAWRAVKPENCKYDAENEKYVSWPAEDCSMLECLKQHRRAGMNVDVNAVTSLLRRKLKQVAELEEEEVAVEGGEGKRKYSIQEMVQKAREEWPPLH